VRWQRGLKEGVPERGVIGPTGAEQVEHDCMSAGSTSSGRGIGEREVGVPGDMGREAVQSSALSSGASGMRVRSRRWRNDRTTSDDLCKKSGDS
jgi:hypothetical protein